jgi:hypothetical protein
MREFILGFRHGIMTGTLLCVAFFALESQALAQFAGTKPPITAAPAPLDIRDGGVLAESHSSHHQVAPAPGPWPRVTPQNGWYHYGFPVSSTRWGWFGAERYYPLNFSHQGYNGDYSRIGYRYGF